MVAPLSHTPSVATCAPLEQTVSQPLALPGGPPMRSCTGEAEACTPIAGRACRRSACDAVTGAVTTEECAGFCTTGAAPSLVSARLSNDGRQILLRFDAAVYATSHLPRCEDE